MPWGVLRGPPVARSGPGAPVSLLRSLGLLQSPVVTAGSLPKFDQTKSLPPEFAWFGRIFVSGLEGKDWVALFSIAVNSLMSDVA